MEQQNENKSGDDQKNENKNEKNQQNENQSGKDQQNKNEEVFYNLDGVGKNEPIFNIIKRGGDNVEVKAKSRINLAISLSKFRKNYLFHFDKIELHGDIYQEDYFQFFLEIACKEDDEFVNDERFLPYSPYLYAYSDIWGFDELKQKIDKLWQDNPEFLKKHEEKDKNESFINNLISYIDQINTNSIPSDASFTNITPAEYFEENINTILKEAEKNNFIHVSPRILNIIIQSIHKEKLDGKIYFDFLMKYIEEADKKDLLFYEPLISYIDFDVLTYENIEKFVNLNFSKTKSKHINSEVSTRNLEKNKDEKEEKNKDEKEEKNKDEKEEKNKEEKEDKNKDEKEDKNKDEKEDKNKDEKEDKNKGGKDKGEAAEAIEGEEEEEEEEEEELKEDDYFNFLTFTQFRSFARKLVDENKSNRKEIEELKKSIEALKAKYDESEKNLNKCFVKQQTELSHTTNEAAKEIETKIEYNQKRIDELAKNNKDLDKIWKDVEVSYSEYNKISEEIENIKSSVESMKYKYNISSYIISAINRQFIPINRSEKSIMKIDKDIDGIRCIADLNNQNDNTDISFDFTTIKGKDNNPIIYFYPNSNVKAQSNQNENENKNKNDNDNENENKNKNDNDNENENKNKNDNDNENENKNNDNENENKNNDNENENKNKNDNENENENENKNNDNENENKNKNDNENENKNEIFIDFMIREYEIEVEDSDFQKLISWEIEGFFPKDFDSYKKYKNYEKISDDQWFPISVHSAADAIIYDDKYKSNQQFDTLFTDNKYKIYKCHMGFSPICKCIRFKMIRNSSDTNIMKISRFQITGQVLQPFKPQIKS